MLTKKEIQAAIRDAEQHTETLQECQKLATFYTLYDHLYGAAAERTTLEEIVPEIEIGSSPFLEKIQGKDSKEAWKLMAELMEAVQVLQPKLYEQTMKRLE